MCVLSVRTLVSVQMLDLLVYLAARCKISPSDHALQVLDSGTGKQVNFKPHQTIGSVGTGKIIVVPKGKSRIDMGRSQSVKSFEVSVSCDEQSVLDRYPIGVSMLFPCYISRDHVRHILLLNYIHRAPWNDIDRRLLLAF